MPKLRTLSGDDLLRILSQFGFTKHTFNAIFRQAIRYIPESALAPFFFAE